MATIGEMIVRLLADTSNFNASMDEAAAKVTASNDAMAASMASSMQSFRNFDAITKESVKSTEGLAEAQAALQAVQQTGAFTAEELAAKQALVDAAMLKVGKETEAASGALSMFTRNSRTMYSTSALITDAMTGQFSRMRREVAALGNETGLMAQAFQFALSPAGLIAEALAAVALDAYNATQRINELQHAVLAGGGASGLSGDQLETMAEGFKKMGFDIQSARDAEDALSASGRVTQSDMDNATKASLAYAQITGEKIDTLAKKFASVGTEGATGFIKLDESMHFLTNSQRENIAQLAKQGETAQAVSVGYSALAAHGMLALQQLQSEGKKTEGFWAGVGTVIQNVNDSAMKGMGFGLTKQDELDKTNKLIAYYQQIGVTGQKINDLLKQRADLMAQIAAQARTASSRGAGAQGGIQADEALLHGGLHEKSAGGIGALESKFQQQEAAARASYDQMKQDAADFWNAQATDARNSAAVQAAAWQKYIDARHQLDEQGLRNESEADRQREQSALKAAEAAKRAAEERARAEERASAEIQQEVQKENALQLRDAEGAQQIARKRIEIDRQALQNQYDAHQINAQQLLQGQLRLDDELLAAELAYLNKKKELDAGDVAAVARDQQQITLAVLEADQRRLQDEDKTLKTSEQRWKQYGQRIAGAVQNSFNSMLFQGQKLKNGLASVAESILETFLENVVEQPLQAFIAGEGQKLAAAIGFGAQKTATENAQRATNAAADVADKTAASARAAGLAGAQGVASFAAAPWPIDIGAPAFGAAMMASALSFGAMASAAGGWERVPADGMLTELHRDEMVLPKHVADPMRNMARNGGGNAGGAIHIHATDAASFKDLLRRNPGILAGGMRHAAARGHL